MGVLSLAPNPLEGVASLAACSWRRRSSGTFWRAAFIAVVERRMTLPRRPLYFGIRPLVGLQRRVPLPPFATISFLSGHWAVKTCRSLPVHSFCFVYPVPSRHVLETDRPPVFAGALLPVSWCSFFVVLLLSAWRVGCIVRAQSSLLRPVFKTLATRDALF